jgi:IS30 family transposase
MISPFFRTVSCLNYCLKFGVHFKQPGVSVESIYQRIYADKRKGGTLHLTLRCQKERKKRHTGRARRGSIPNQVSIDLRPAVVGERARFGDWEADLVIGAGHKQALVTINERISRYSLIAHVPFKTAELVDRQLDLRQTA